MTDNRLKVPANLQNLRSLMPVVSDYAYFDHAAVSPLPKTAHAAITAWVNQAHLSGDAHWLKWNAQAEATRSACARLLNADISEICLIPSTTFGINIVAGGLKWKPGDSVVVPSNEFPSNYLAWRFLSERGVEIRTVDPEPSGELKIEKILQQVDSTTKLIAISWVGYSTGFRIDLAPLIDGAHQKNALVFVDAIQGLGAFPLDAESLQVDFLAADGHKWMLGPEGAGLLYVARRNLDRLSPHMLGAKSVVWAGDYNTANLNLKQSAARFEGGSTNMVGMIGFGASLQTLLDAGCDDPSSGFAQGILDVCEYAVERLRSIGGEVYRNYDAANYSGIVSFNIPGNTGMDLRRHCLTQNVILSVRNDRMRIAIHGYNNSDDIDRLINAITSY